MKLHVKDKSGRNPFVQIFICFLLFLLMLSIIYPIYYLLMYSLSTYGGLATLKNPFMLKPAGFTLQAFQTLMRNRYILSGYKVTIFRTVVGTLASVFIIGLTAYPLSKEDLPFRRVLVIYIMISMFFDAGLIPTYLTMRGYNLLDNIWLLVLLPLCNTYYVLLLRSYFESLPPELYEVSQIDGASEWQVFIHIMMPIALPSLVTIGTWMFFKHWNTYFDSMVYFHSYDRQVVQVQIRRLVVEQSDVLLGGTTFSGKADMPTEESMRAAGIMITILPVLIIYPFVRKYFTKGMVLGAVKG